MGWRNLENAVRQDFRDAAKYRGTPVPDQREREVSHESRSDVLRLPRKRRIITWP